MQPQRALIERSIDLPGRSSLKMDVLVSDVTGGAISGFGSDDVSRTRSATRRADYDTGDYAGMALAIRAARDGGLQSSSTPIAEGECP